MSRTGKRNPAKARIQSRLRYHEGPVRVIRCPDNCAKVNGIYCKKRPGHWVICTTCDGTGGIKVRMK